MPPKGLTARTQKRQFLDGIERGMSVKKAAHHAGIHRTTPYTWEIHDPTFKRDWNEIRALRLRRAIDAAYEVAIDEQNVPMLKWLINRYESQDREQPTPITIRVIQQEATEDGSHQDFITTSP